VERRQATWHGATDPSSWETHLRYGDREPSLILYLDTSALLKLYFEEDGSDTVSEQVAHADVVATSWVAYVEARAAFARRLSPRERRQALVSLDNEWPRYFKVDVTEPLLRDAAVVADRYRLRAYDAVHLASARVVRLRRGEPMTFASWDRELDEAAARDGFTLSSRRSNR
jgi:predicted nucleic acid-binding protein